MCSVKAKKWINLLVFEFRGGKYGIKNFQGKKRNIQIFFRVLRKITLDYLVGSFDRVSSKI